MNKEEKDKLKEIVSISKKLEEKIENLSWSTEDSALEDLMLMCSNLIGDIISNTEDFFRI